jgi:hypothetical protein
VNGDEVDPSPHETLLKLDETILSLDEVKPPSLDVTSTGDLLEVLDSLLPHHPTISDATVEVPHLESERALSSDPDWQTVQTGGEATSPLLLLPSLGLRLE